MALTVACDRSSGEAPATASPSAVPPRARSADAPPVPSPSFRLRPKAPQTPATVVASCAAKAFYYEQVRDACERGGFYAAKALMKKQVSRAKAAGKKVSCKSCHRSVDTYTLKDNAVEDLEPWL